MECSKYSLVSFTVCVCECTNFRFCRGYCRALKCQIYDSRFTQNWERSEFLRGSLRESSVFIVKDRGVQLPFTSIRCANLSEFTRARLELVSQLQKFYFNLTLLFSIFRYRFKIAYKCNLYYRFRLLYSGKEMEFNFSRRYTRKLNNLNSFLYFQLSYGYLNERNYIVHSLILELKN